MSTRRRNFGSAQTWFALGAVATFIYGVETWRRHTSVRASHAEQARFHAVVTCLLGADGARLAYAPAEARRRLRALAMDTPLAPAPTWIDRCVPLLRDLAVRGAEVDVTHDPRGAPTAVARHARELALLTARVGLVWQIRGGDPVFDMESIAEALTRTATEIDLAAVTPTRESLKGPRAPVPTALPTFARVPFGALLPLPSGTPARFLAGAPTPLLSTVTVRDGDVRVEALAADDARWWRVVPGGVVRVVAEEGAPDGLSAVRLDTFLGEGGTGRIAAPPQELDPRAVSLDAAVNGRALWLAEAIRGRAPVLARLPFAGVRGEAATAARLTRGAADAAADGARVDEEVAVTAAGRSVVAAYTEHLGRTGLIAVRAVRADGGERAVVHEVEVPGEPWVLRGRRVGVGLCASQGATWLFAASGEAWRVGVVRDGAIVDVAHATRTEGRSWDDALTLRCSPQGVLAYGRERPRRSPLWRCLVGADGVARCDALPRLDATQPGDLDPWTTLSAHGERRAHPEWPLGYALTRDGTVIALRVAGTVAAVSRLPRGAERWSPERVVFDAAAEEARRTVYGAEVYSDGGSVLVAVSDTAELAVMRSEDDGVTWRAP